MDNAFKRKKKRRTGRPPMHGAFALVYRDEVVRQFPELTRYTRDVYDGLLDDLAPEGKDTLPIAKRIILDRLLSKLLTAGLLDIYLGQHGILQREALARKTLECEPAVNTWLAVNHAILRDLQALGLERKELEPRDISPLDIAAEIDAKKAASKDVLSEIVHPGASQGHKTGKGEDNETDHDQTGQAAPAAANADVDRAGGDGVGQTYP
jgi:hypothetical protein